MAVVLGAFVPDTAAQWRSVVKAEVARQLGVEAEAKKVEARLERLAAAIPDAEARAARGDDAAAVWLAMARHAAYEADAAVDRCRVAARRHRGREHQHQALPWLLSTCCDVDEPRRGIAGDLKNVSLKLQAILKEQRQLQLHASGAGRAVHARAVLRRRIGHSTDAGNIVGARIEDDARRLVRRLTQADADGQAACAVVAVVGPDGIGKTTLAKVVYDGEMVRRSFEIRSWVRLPRGYTDAGLLAQVIDAVGGDTAGGESVADLEAMLAGLVLNRRFLLVLDGAWHGMVWDDVLRSPFGHGGRGSKVLVTARHGSIAREMGAGYVHRVRRLGADDGWALLRAAACVVDADAGESDDGGELRHVGERIVEKCGGNPLSIKAIAGVLRTRAAASAEEWAAVLASPAWSVKGLPDDAMKPLYVSYDDMPCHLKQCFLYCSLSLSDVAVDRRVLVQQWIAGGLVEIRGDTGVEDVAEAYYDELIGRNLLQPVEEANLHGCIDRCTMHDMLRALAQLLSHGEGLTGDVHWLPDDDDVAPRYVSFPARNLDAIPDKILKFDGIRTLLLQRNPLTTEGNIFTALHNLKVLDLSETAIDLIPETLGNLVYLRFLNLSQTRIHALPDSIGNLWSLKFLLLRECKSLNALPKGMEQLRGLRELDLAGTVINDAAFRVGHLRSLTSLRCFAVARKEDRSGWPLVELKNLCHLRTLHVHKLENANGRSEAAEVALAMKTSLRELELSCNGAAESFRTPAMVGKIEGIFEELTPPKFLESLKISNYFGTKFPRWMSLVYLPNLRRLNIIGCNFCQSFPPLGRLLELKYLCIADSSALTDIDEVFMDIDSQFQVPFPKLENLHLQGLHKLETWTGIEAGALPSLQALQLESCPKLRCLPAGLGHVTSLTELRIVDMSSLETVEDIAALRELSVWNAPNLKKISDLPSLEDLNICHCPLLDTVENINRLQAVHILDHELREMPRWIEAQASKLRSLDITSTNELLVRCLVDGPDWPLIKDIVQVRGYSTGSSYIYYSKSPYIFETNVSIQENLDMERNAADSDKGDDPYIESRNIDEEFVPVSVSGTDYLEISGFFDSKVVKTGTARNEDNVPGGNMERSIPRLTRRRMHKLAEVPEDDEDIDSILPFPADTTTKAVTSMKKLRPAVADDHTDNNNSSSLSEAIIHESHVITNEGTGHGTTANSALTRRRSKMGKDAPTDSDTAVIKSSALTGHNLVREGSRAISITEAGQDFNLNLFPEMVKQVPTKVTKSESNSHGSENKSSANLACSSQTTLKKEKDVSTDVHTTTAAICSSNKVSRKHIDKVKKIPASAAAIKNAATMQEHISRKEVTKQSADFINSNLIHADSHTSATETIQDSHSSLPCSEEQSPNVAKYNTSSAVDGNCDQMEGKNIDFSVKLNPEESKTVCATEITCDSGPCKSTATLQCSKQQTVNRQEAVFADPSADTDASMKKILSMASKISEKVGSKYTAESFKNSSAGAIKNIARSSSKPMRSMSHAIDITEATTKAQATMTNRSSTNAAANDGLTNDKTPPFSINVEVDDSHQAPKVYTAIWADTDTDTLRARLLSSMQHYHRMASRRRRRHRKHGSKWSIGTVLVAVLLLVSVVQLLFILSLYRRLLNQNSKVDGQ